MDFDLKNYQTFKLKKHFKTNKVVVFFYITKLNLAQWTNIEQTLKKLKLKYYKTLNKPAIKMFKNSIFKHFNSCVGGLVLLVNSDSQVLDLIGLKDICNSLKFSFILLGLKCNNKIYPAVQLKKVRKLSCKNNVLVLNRVLEKYLKSYYLLAKPK